MAMYFRMNSATFHKTSIIFIEKPDYYLWNSSNRLIDFSNSGNWNGKVTLPYGAGRVSFTNCNSFNQPINIPNSVTSTGGMFSACRNFNQPINIPNSVTNTSFMFHNCRNFNQPITIPEGVSSAYEMFRYCSNFNQPINIPNSVTYANSMFCYCDRLGEVNIYIDNINNGDLMFYGCNKLSTLRFFNIGLFSNLSIPNNNSLRKNIFINKTKSRTYVRNTLENISSLTLTNNNSNNCSYNTYYNLYIYNTL